MVVTGSLLLERERELTQLERLVDAVAAGAAGSVLVEGPAGAGKSAVLEALAACARDRRLMVLRAVAVRFGRDYSFGVVRQLFEPAIAELNVRDRENVFQGAAVLARPIVTSGSAALGEGLGDSGFALSHSLYWVLSGLTEVAPVAVVVDDLQWSDVPSLRFLAFVLKRLAGLPLLVACARRDGPLRDSTEADVLEGVRSTIRPAPLSPDAISALLSDAAGHPVSREIVLEAARLTDGNPLFVRELTDAVRGRRGKAVADPVLILDQAAPSAVGRRVNIALGRLDSEARRLATAAAVLGDGAPLRRAAQLAEVGHGAASVAADALVQAALLAVGDPLRFRHPLVHATVLESVPARELAVLHGRAARVLIADGCPPEHAAVHLLQSDPAGDVETVKTLRSAARRAIVESAPALAIKALRRALSEPPPPEERPSVLKELALAEAQVGDQAALAHFEDAFAQTTTLGDMADGAVRYAMLLAGRGNVEEGERIIDQVLDAVGDREAQLMLEAELYTLAMSSHVTGARERLNRIVVDLSGGTAAERLLLGLHANDAANTGAIDAATAARRVGAALGDGWLLRQLGPNSPTYLLMAGAGEWLDVLDVAERELSAALIEAQLRGAAFGVAIISSMLGAVAWKRGQLARAEAETRTGLHIAAEMGWVSGYPIPVVYLIDVLTDRGAFNDADQLLEEHHLDGPLPESMAATMLLGSRGRLRLAQGSLEDGIADLEEQAHRIQRAGDSPPYLLALRARSVVPALMRTGRVEEAHHLASRTLRLTQAFGQPRGIADATRASALAHSDGPEIEQLRAAAAIYETIGAQLELARTLLDIGSALRRRRHAAQARAPLRQALDLASRCGAQPLADRAYHELRAAGARPRRDRITGQDALTATEQRIAQLAINGMTNRQIAETMFVTQKTVGSHLEHIYRKLDVHARGELQHKLQTSDDL